MKKKFILSLSVLLLIVMLLAPAALAFTPYEGYTYDVWSKSVPSPVGYLPEGTINGKDLGIGDFSNPSDMYDNKNTKELFILDAGNNRVVVLDYNLEVLRVLDKLTMKNGTSASFDNPEGITVDNEGNIYICDTKNKRIVKFGPDQKELLTITLTKEKSDILRENYVFYPQKVVVGLNGELYCVAEGTIEGMAKFDSNGNFKGFFGSPKIKNTADVILENFWRQFMTEKQIENRARILSIEYSNVYMRKDGFMFACVRNSADFQGQVVRLNFHGDNTLTEANRALKSLSLPNLYGDYEVSGHLQTGMRDNIFVDICIDEENNYINVLDREYKRVFQYDADGNLLFIYGAHGDQLGAFDDPVALDIIDGKHVVLDMKKGNLTVFGASEFGKKVHTAVDVFNSGNYDEALAPWEEVLKYNANYDFAHVGIGKVYFNLRDFKNAKNHFFLAEDRDNYSKAFREYRSEVIKNNFGIVVLIIVLIPLLIFVFKKVKAKAQAKKNGKGEN